MNLSAWKSALSNGGSLIYELGLKMLRIRRNNQSDSSINEILLYGAENEEHQKQIGLNNLLCIYYVILHASSSVDVCVPSLTSDTLTKCLISVRQKNKVSVRIVIHSSEDFHNLQLFAQNGIEVKVMKPAVRLAHEFVVVDGRAGDAVAALGALDYDTARLNCNRDATLLSSDPALITALNREFERVWNSIPELTPTKTDQV